ncbi:hypothetical protein CDAR_503041 [Caerostris darwini]|uniref:Uncharacterized protein n=1 Tax=Caerostris darwini TaxID=1538125 RepID=A0AAV4VMS8_9ARAC|nr:hypothetical protein CDAR_503041 [Caerostris darwini]
MIRTAILLGSFQGFRREKRPLEEAETVKSLLCTNLRQEGSKRKKIAPTAILLVSFQGFRRQKYPLEEGETVKSLRCTNLRQEKKMATVGHFVRLEKVKSLRCTNLRQEGSKKIINAAVGHFVRFVPESSVERPRFETRLHGVSACKQTKRIRQQHESGTLSDILKYRCTLNREASISTISIFSIVGSNIDIADARRKPYTATNQFPSFQKRRNERRHGRRRNSMTENERKGAPGQGLQMG